MPEVAPQPVAPPVAPQPSKGTIAACVLLALFGVFMCVRTVATGIHQMHEDEKVEELDLDADRPKAEVDAERLLHETEALEAEKEQLRRECTQLEERLLALDARAPEMPPIDTWVAVVQGDYCFLAAGTDEKVEKGFQFSIRRNAKFVARVVVQEVRDRVCACRIVLVKEGDVIKVGDQAATKLD